MIRLENLRKTYRGASAPAVKDLSLDIPKGHLVTLLGASGCGKTTTLRCLAGLEEPDSGEILIDDKPVFSSSRGISVPPHQRQIGMVFQSYAIWPHMTVYENVAYPLKSVGAKKADIDEAVNWALALVNLSAFADRPAPLLSGGQQQRVALARALADRPRVLLLDEPLSNLDAKLRDQMRFELRELLTRLDITAVYVTHDQDDAFSLSDLTAMMSQGRIVEFGHPAGIYQMPRTIFGAEFLGVSTKTAGHVLRTAADGVVEVETGLGIVSCRTHDPLPQGAPVAVYIRPEEFHILPPGTVPSPEAVEVEIARITLLGGTLEWAGDIAGIAVRGRIQIGSQEDAYLGRETGTKRHIRISLARCLPAANDTTTQ